MRLEIVDGLSTDLRCSLRRSLSRRLVSPLHFGAVVALYHVNDVFGVTVNVISDRPGSPVAWNVYGSLSVRYVFTR